MEHDDGGTTDQWFLRRLMAPPPIDPDAPAPPPDSILLDPDGFISPRENDTTAEAKTRNGHTIRVTFWPAKPPRVSCFTVHCPDLPDHAFGDYPRIVTSEADLVLLRIAICRRGAHQYPDNCDFFVYKAGNNKKRRRRRPSLDLIPGDPDPDPNFTDSDTVLLPCRSRNMYFITKLGDWALSGDGGQQFDIYVYNSKKRTWSTRLMYASKDFNYCYASKVITIGGPRGSVGWVDLWRGILICDLLQDGRHLRYIPLPSPSVPQVLKGPPTHVRDIVVVQGTIKYFHMRTYVKVDPGSGSYVWNGWGAETSELDPNKQRLKWKDDCRVELSELTMTDPAYVQMLLNNQGVDGEEDAEAMLRRLCAGCPSLSLHHDGVVYITNKLVFHGEKAWVIAVDMRHKTLHDAAYYHVSGRGLGYGSAFYESGICKHLAARSATS